MLCVICGQSLTYGEVEFAAFSEVLQIAKDWCGRSCKKFYDLGSGDGRAVFTVSCELRGALAKCRARLWI